LFDAFNLRSQSPTDWENTVEEPTLIVGDLLRWRRNGRNTKTFDHFHFSCFAELSAETFAVAKPAIVLSPLMADTFDAMDVAGFLCAVEFKGLYRAIASEKIEPAVIRQDIKACAPNLDFDVLLIPDLIAA